MNEEIIRPVPPPDAVIIVSDERGRTDSWGRERGAPYMWAWLGGKDWFYVRDHPIPDSYKGRRT